MNADKLLQQTKTTYEEVQPHLRACADVFHENEGELFTRTEAISLLEDEVDIDSTTAARTLGQLVGDTVDPIIQIEHKGEKYVGIIEFHEFAGAYGYINYDDLFGQGKRVVCQQCVNDATLDAEVTHATENDPVGSFSGGATWDELLAGIHEHYEQAHDSVPEDVATGATLASGTTIGGNTAFHKGNDGNGSGLDADNIRGTDASTFASNAAPVQTVNGSTGDVSVDHSGLSNIQRGDHHTPVVFDFKRHPDFFGGNGTSPGGEGNESVATSNGNVAEINKISVSVKFSAGNSTPTSAPILEGKLDSIEVFNPETSSYITAGTPNFSFRVEDGQSTTFSDNYGVSGFVSKMRANMTIDNNDYDNSVSISGSADIKVPVFE